MMLRNLPDHLKASRDLSNKHSNEIVSLYRKKLYKNLLFWWKKWNHRKRPYSNWLKKKSFIMNSTSTRNLLNLNKSKDRQVPQNNKIKFKIWSKFKWKSSCHKDLLSWKPEKIKILSKIITKKPLLLPKLRNQLKSKIKNLKIMAKSHSIFKSTTNKKNSWLKSKNSRNKIKISHKDVNWCQNQNDFKLWRTWKNPGMKLISS